MKYQPLALHVKPNWTSGERTKRYPIRSVMKTFIVPAMRAPTELPTKMSETAGRSALPTGSEES